MANSPDITRGSSISGDRGRPGLAPENPIFEAVYVGRPWTELDFLQAMTTSAPIFIQLNHMFPEVIAVNALYTHGLVVIVSTKVRYGGFGKSVASAC